MSVCYATDTLREAQSLRCARDYSIASVNEVYFVAMCQNTNVTCQKWMCSCLDVKFSYSPRTMGENALPQIEK
jgi:hypothetical protein